MPSYLAACSCALLSVSVSAQVPPAPPDLPPAPALPAPPKDAANQKYREAPGATYLERVYRIDRAEAERRARLEPLVSEAAGKLQAQFGEQFLGSIIDHAPNYSVTFVFDREVAPSEIQSSIPNDLQPVAHTKRSRYTRAQINERGNKLIAALAAIKLHGSVGYDYRTDKFEVTAESDGNSLVRSLPPELRSDVRFVSGGSPALFQTGAKAGDAIYGGWRLMQLTSGGGQQVCTFGFIVVTADNSNGVTANSAEHCQVPVGVIYDDGHTVALPTPHVTNQYVYNNSFGIGRSYDYRVFKVGSLVTGPYAWFWNNLSGSYHQYVYPNWVQKNWANRRGTYIANGAYSRVIGVIAGTSGTANANHPQGAVRCKGGITTGITCGQITLSEAGAVNQLPDGSYQTFYGYVKIETNDPEVQVLAYEGDSGAPVTTEPLWNINAQYYDVRAAGIMAIGSTRNRGDGYPRPCISPTDGACPAYYMPIDRINDHVSIRVLTTVGAVDPN